jgi:hypothetical protein
LGRRGKSRSLHYGRDDGKISRRDDKAKATESGNSKLENGQETGVASRKATSRSLTPPKTRGFGMTRAGVNEAHTSLP